MKFISDFKQFSRQNIRESSTISHNSEDTGYNEDKLGFVMEGKDNISVGRNSNFNNTCFNCLKPSDPQIEHNHPFYFYKASKIL